MRVIQTDSNKLLLIIIKSEVRNQQTTAQTSLVSAHGKRKETNYTKTKQQKEAKLQNSRINTTV